jgi:hypothetical protein
LHEFEALLLSKALQFKAFYADAQERALRGLADLVANFPSPEDMDDGRETTPAKRIAKFFPRYPKEKKTAALTIAKAIGLPGIRERCRHFDAWLTKLEGLGSRSGSTSAGIGSS